MADDRLRVAIDVVAHRVAAACLGVANLVQNEETDQPLSAETVERVYERMQELRGTLDPNDEEYNAAYEYLREQG